jgi:hypothetical protein
MACVARRADREIASRIAHWRLLAMMNRAVEVTKRSSDVSVNVSNGLALDL